MIHGVPFAGLVWPLRRFTGAATAIADLTAGNGGGKRARDAANSGRLARGEISRPGLRGKGGGELRYISIFVEAEGNAMTATDGGTRVPQEPTEQTGPEATEGAEGAAEMPRTRVGVEPRTRVGVEPVGATPEAGALLGQATRR